MTNRLVACSRGAAAIQSDISLASMLYSLSTAPRYHVLLALDRN